ncbi:MAG: hypothetical protein ACKVZ6_10995 [Kineosporiaceae bacterium]
MPTGGRTADSPGAVPPAPLGASAEASGAGLGSVQAGASAAATPARDASGKDGPPRGADAFDRLVDGLSGTGSDAAAHALGDSARPTLPTRPAPAAPADVRDAGRAGVEARTGVEAKSGTGHGASALPPVGGRAAGLTGDPPASGLTGELAPGRLKPSATPVPATTRGDSGNGRQIGSNGGAPRAWDASLPTELTARAAADAAAQRYRPANPHAPMIGSDAPPAQSTPTPIFDSISAWFSADASAPTTGSLDPVDQVVDLRDGARTPVTAGAPSSNRWASLGDQQWLAASARAAANPEISGTTQTGLPKRRPGANLVPSASTGGASARAAAPGVPAASGVMPSAAVHRADPETVRGRLGSYQRGLTSARRSRRAPGDPAAAESMFGAAGNDKGATTAQTPEGTGGDT